MLLQGWVCVSGCTSTCCWHEGLHKCSHWALPHLPKDNVSARNESGAFSRAMSAAALDSHSALIFSEHCQSVQLLIQPQYSRGWTWQILCNYTELQLSSFTLFHLDGRQITVCCVVLVLHLLESAVIPRARLRVQLYQRLSNSWTPQHSGIKLIVFSCNLHVQQCWGFLYVLFEDLMAVHLFIANFVS